MISKRGFLFGVSLSLFAAAFVIWRILPSGRLGEAQQASEALLEPTLERRSQVDMVGAVPTLPGNLDAAQSRDAFIHPPQLSNTTGSPVDEFAQWLNRFHVDGGKVELQ